jgi:hypothetical protein
MRHEFNQVFAALPRPLFAIHAAHGHTVHIRSSQHSGNGGTIRRVLPLRSLLKQGKQRARCELGHECEHLSDCDVENWHSRDLKRVIA